MNHIHVKQICDLCDSETHGYFIVNIGGSIFKICNNCNAMIERKKETLPRTNFYYMVEIGVEAVSQEDADHRFQRHIDKYFGKSIKVWVEK